MDKPGSADKTENATEEFKGEVLGAGWRWGSSAGGSLSRCRDLDWVPSSEKRKREKEGRGREKRKYLVWVTIREASRLFPLLPSYIYWPSPFCWSRRKMTWYMNWGLCLMSSVFCFSHYLCLQHCFPSNQVADFLNPNHATALSFCVFEHCPDCYPLNFFTRFEFPHHV